MDHDLRTEGRYFVVTPLQADIAGNNADLIDISTKGARLQLTQRVAVGRPMPFTLRTADVAIATTATPVWCEMGALSLNDEELDRYFCGVTFDRSLSVIAHLIEDLVNAGSAIPMSDNRGAERYRVIAPLSASFGELPELRVLDISIRGARVMTPRLLRTGASARLRFAINGDDTQVWLPATVMWSRPAERKGRYEAGLRITHAEDWLRTVIDELALREGVVIETDSMMRKFDPLVAHPVPGLVGVRR
jgi:hypothetical protein